MSDRVDTAEGPGRRDVADAEWDRVERKLRNLAALNAMDDAERYALDAETTGGAGTEQPA